MKRRILTGLRFFLYGIVCFGVFGVFLQWPHTGISNMSNKLVIYMALIGGVSFFFSYVAALLLWHIFRDLTNGSD